MMIFRQDQGPQFGKGFFDIHFNCIDSYSYVLKSPGSRDVVFTSEYFGPVHRSPPSYRSGGPFFKPTYYRPPSTGVGASPAVAGSRLKFLFAFPLTGNGVQSTAQNAPPPVWFFPDHHRWSLVRCCLEKPRAKNCGSGWKSSTLHSLTKGADLLFSPHFFVSVFFIE